MFLLCLSFYLVCRSFLYIKPSYSWLQTFFSNSYKLSINHINKYFFHRKLSHLDFTLKVNCIFVFFNSHLKFLFIFIHFDFWFLLTFRPYFQSFKKNYKYSLCIINSFSYYLLIFSRSLICLLTIFVISFPIQNFILVYIQYIILFFKIQTFVNI